VTRADITSQNKHIRTEIRQDGWLVILAYYLIFSWSRWVSFNGFAKFYKKTEAEGVKGVTWLQDIIHLTWAILAITSFCCIESVGTVWRAAIFAFASFRIFDLFIDFVMLAVFGNRYGRPWAGVMPPQRLQRTLIIDGLLLLELIFWNATWVFGVSTHDCTYYEKPIETAAHALHVSMATATTIGYGTYAPVKTGPILAAFLESLSALLLVTGVIGGILSRISSVQNDAHEKTKPPKSADQLTGLPILWDHGWGWTMRHITPLVIPVLMIWGLTCWLLRSDWIH